MPAWWRLSASASPPTPPPTISTSATDSLICTCSFWHNPALGDDLGPACPVARHDRRQFPRRRGGGHQPLRFEGRTRLRRGEERGDLAVEPLDEVGRHAARREQAVPHIDIDAGEALLGQGRKLGQL